MLPIADFHAYVKSVARHVCMRCRRRDGETTESRTQQDISRAATLSANVTKYSSAGMWQCTLEEDLHPVASEDRGNSPLEQTWRKETLQHAWQEILLLPEKQRVALLLNFCDTSGAHLLPLLIQITGVTTKALAEALGFSETAFGLLQECLPLEDQAIAVRLGLTRREVINARLSARRRLARRCQEWIETIEA